MATSGFTRSYSTDFSYSEDEGDITGTYASIACQCILYGVQLTFTLCAAYTLLFVQTRSKATVWLFSMTIVTLASSTIYVIFSLEIAVCNTISDTVCRTIPFNVVIRMESTLFYLPSVNYLCSDIILLWRAYVLWTHDRRVFILPASLLSGSLVATFASIGSKGETTGALSPHAGVRNQNMADWTIYASWVLTLATNIVLTSMIGLQAWQYSRFSTVSSSCTKSTRSLGIKIVILMVESGAVYCVFWVVLVIVNLQFPGSESLRSGYVWMAGSVIQDISVQISGIYPMIIIVIVALKRSIADTAPADTSLPSFVARNRALTTSASIAPAHTQSHEQFEPQFESDVRSNILVVGFEASQKSGEAENTGEANSAFTETEATA